MAAPSRRSGGAKGTPSVPRHRARWTFARSRFGTRTRVSTDLYLRTFLNTDCGKDNVSVDGMATTHDLYLAEYGGTTANL